MNDAADTRTGKIRTALEGILLRRRREPMAPEAIMRCFSHDTPKVNSKRAVRPRQKNIDTTISRFVDTLLLQHNF